MNFKGTQIAIDLYGCLENKVTKPDDVKKILQEATETFLMEPKAYYYNEDNDEEKYVYSYIIPCKKGHLNVVVYPKIGYVGIDVFTCNEMAKPEKLAIFLRNQFSPDKAQTTFLERGNFGSKNDLKPRKKTLVKTSRRAKTARDHILKLLLKPKSM